MHKSRRSTLILVALLAFGLVFPAIDGAAAPAGVSLAFTRLVSGFDKPLQYVFANDGSNRDFIIQQHHDILVRKDGEMLPAPFLDMTGRLSEGAERGILSMALHPDFAENGTVFVNFTDVDGHTNVARFTVDAANPDRLDPASEVTILKIEQPYSNHNGGLLLFGPDGFLYIGMGDGGSTGDPENRAQDLTDLLGKILRIDVNATDGSLYAVPSDNPYVGKPDARPEIYVVGVRNPWRFSFDRETGDLVIGDVGQDSDEEVNFLPAGEIAGANLGWSEMEGYTCFGGGDCEMDRFTMPVATYTHEFGCSITGGYVYRGRAIPGLVGKYLFADYCRGFLWIAEPSGQESWEVSDPIETGLLVTSFAEGPDGELYIVGQEGGIYRIDPAA